MFINNKTTIATNLNYKSIIYKKCEYFWSYLGKIAVLTRQLLNAAINDVCFSGDPSKARAAIARLKLLSIVGVAFNLVTIQATAKTVLKNGRSNDPEGVFLGSFSISLMAADVVDSLATFINALLTVASRAPVALLSAIGIPLGFGMSGFGSLSRIIQIAKTHAIFKKIHPNNRDELLKLKDNKETLLRVAPQEVLNEIDLITDLLKNEKLSEEDAQKLLQSLDRIRFFLRKKMVVDSVNLITNIISLIGLTLLFTTAPPSLPFYFMATSFTLKITALTLQDLL